MLCVLNTKMHGAYMIGSTFNLNSQDLTQTQQTQQYDFDENSQSNLGTPCSPKFEKMGMPKNPLTIPWGRLSSTSSDIDNFGRIANSNVQLLPRSPLSPFIPQDNNKESIKFLGLELNPSDRFNEYTIGRSAKCDIVPSKPSLGLSRNKPNNPTSANTGSTTLEEDQLQMKEQSKKLKFVHDLISNSHCRIFCLLKHDSTLGTRTNKTLFTSPTTAATSSSPLSHDINSLEMEVYIEDTSSNGTYINNNTLLKRNERRILHTGDVICLLNPLIIQKKIRNPTESEEFLKHYTFVFVNLFQTCGGNDVHMDYENGSRNAKGPNLRFVQQLENDSLSYGNMKDVTPGSKTPTSAVKKSVLGLGQNSNRKRGLVNVRAMNHSHDKATIFSKVAALDHSNAKNEYHLMPPPSKILNTKNSDQMLNSARKKQKTDKQSHRRVEEEYDIRDVIGSGTCGQVRRAIHRRTGEMVAIKVISLGNAPGSMNRTLSSHDDDHAMEMVDKIIQDEASILQSLNHPYIIKLIDVFIHPEKKAVYLVMELIQGGDLFDRIVAKGRYTEIESRRVMRRLLAAIFYLHEKRDIVHRDLKPENILCVSRHDDVNVKLTDFGLAKSITEDGLKTFCGTPQYFAPEVLRRRHTVAGRGRYDKKADMWSLGVILYILLCGAPPFDASSSFDTTQDKYIRMQGKKWENISESAKELVKSLLKTDPSTRISVVDACEHEWILTQDGDTHVHPLEDPELTKLSSKSNQNTNISRDNLVSEKGYIRNSQSRQTGELQSILGSPTPITKIQKNLNTNLSPPESECNVERMTPSQAANFPSHDEHSNKSVTTSNQNERGSLFSLVKQLSKEEKNNVDGSLKENVVLEPKSLEDTGIAESNKYDNPSEDTMKITKEKQSTLSRWFEKE